MRLRRCSRHPELNLLHRIANGVLVYMGGTSLNGTSSPSGSSTISCTLIMFDGSYKFLVCTTYTSRTGQSTLSKISCAVRMPTSPYFFQVLTRALNRTDVFEPLFEVTQDPTSHPELHVFLQRVIGFDTVDDESKTERRFHKKFPYPQFWDAKESPPYSYW